MYNTTAAQRHLREQDLLFMPHAEVPYHDLTPLVRTQVRLWHTISVEPAYPRDVEVSRTTIWNCLIWQNRFELWTIRERSQHLTIQDFVGDTKLVQWCWRSGLHSLYDIVDRAEWTTWPDLTRWTAYWMDIEQQPKTLYLSWQLLHKGLTKIVHQLNRYTNSPIDSIPNTPAPSELPWQAPLPSGPKAIALMDNRELQQCLREQPQPSTHPVYKWNFGLEVTDQSIHLNLCYI